jgi:hypothetical protein
MAIRDYRKQLGFLPLVLVLGHFSLLSHPLTRPLGLAISQENRPIELLTVAFLLTGGVLGIAYALRARRRGESGPVWGFLALFSVALLVVGMDEIAWGQILFGFATPESWREINAQRELTLHNLQGVHPYSEYLNLAFGASGMFGIALPALLRSTGARAPALLNFADRLAPPAALFPWLAVIALTAMAVILGDAFAAPERLRVTLRWLSETGEMLIGITGFLYVRAVKDGPLGRTGVASREAAHPARASPHTP